ncbi:ck1 family protein kinase [Stylonychia lemnae]|uniref:Casein kinase I n=1 Tax=Stylonychia lemnae TaxID=5949 RepID=A0A078B7F2_STYLE|nr:ck1 family protein kinase [Stylonychia lemnae]|eukprot:CDW90420.1 ck1 family protein kinase [Stylonychia lemnae]
MILDNRFQVGRKIGRGISGKIYEAFDLKNQEKCAVKIVLYMLFNIRQFIDENDFEIENIIYLKLQREKHSKQGELFISSGLSNDQQYYIVLKLLGQTLTNKIMIEQVQSLHEVGFCHRDIKPHNILFKNTQIEDIQDYSLIRLIDYGISKSYLTNDGWHILNEKQSKFSGNLLFSSVFQMRFQGPSRRDDLISIFYLMIMLKDKYLPWQSYVPPPITKEKFNRIVTLKEDFYQKACKNSHDQAVNRKLDFKKKYWIRANSGNFMHVQSDKPNENLKQYSLPINSLDKEILLVESHIQQQKFKNKSTNSPKNNPYQNSVTPFTNTNIMKSNNKQFCQNQNISHEKYQQSLKESDLEKICAQKQNIITQQFDQKVKTPLLEKYSKCSQLILDYNEQKYHNFDLANNHINNKRIKVNLGLRKSSSLKIYRFCDLKQQLQVKNSVEIFDSLDIAEEHIDDDQTQTNFNMVLVPHPNNIKKINIS